MPPSRLRISWASARASRNRPGALRSASRRCSRDTVGTRRFPPPRYAALPRSHDDRHGRERKTQPRERPRTLRRGRTAAAAQESVAAGTGDGAADVRSEPMEVQWRRSRNCRRCNGNPGRRAGTKSDLRHAVRPYFLNRSRRAPGTYDAVRRRHSAGTTHPASGHEISGRRR